MGRPKPPDPMQTARQQQGFNREAQADAAQLGQIGQDTPFGSTSYTGEIGSPDRRQTVTLNPEDQARLGSREIDQVEAAWHYSGRRARNGRWRWRNATGAR